MGQARGIETMVYKEDPTALQLLREDFKRAGLRDQELMSVYLLALWVLTYWGRPFE